MESLGGLSSRYSSRSSFVILPRSSGSSSREGSPQLLSSFTSNSSCLPREERVSDTLVLLAPMYLEEHPGRLSRDGDVCLYISKYQSNKYFWDSNYLCGPSCSAGSKTPVPRADLMLSIIFRKRSISAWSRVISSINLLVAALPFVLLNI